MTAPKSGSADRGTPSETAPVDPRRVRRRTLFAATAAVVVVTTAIVVILKPNDIRRTQSALSSSRCPIATRCEAEYAELAGTRLETPGPGQWPGYSGSNFVVGFEHAGTSIAWRISNTRAGPGHIAEIRYSNYFGQDGKLESRKLTLLVNERPREIVFPPTQSWPAWADLEVPDIELTAGDNVIRLACGPADTGRVNIDFMTIY